MQLPASLRIPPRALIRALYSKEASHSVNIFLCGMKTNSITSKRKLIHEALSKNARNVIVYPEWIFADALAENADDLLSLEQYLANCVDVVILPLESVGAYAELGAFASNKTLAKKVIVLNNEIYKRERSFINLGPIAAIKKQKPDNIVYYSEEDFTPTLARIEAKIRNTPGNTTGEVLTNVFNLSVLTLLLVALYAPINRDDIMAHAKIQEPRVDDKHLSAAIKILFQKKLISSHQPLGEKVYRLSEIGKRHYYTEVLPKYGMSHLFFSVRASVLNKNLRRQNKFSGGRAKRILDLGKPNRVVP